MFNLVESYQSAELLCVQSHVLVTLRLCAELGVACNPFTDRSSTSLGTNSKGTWQLRFASSSTECITIKELIVSNSFLLLLARHLLLEAMHLFLVAYCFY